MPGRLSIVHVLSCKCSALCLFLDQLLRSAELHFDFDALEVLAAAHQFFVDVIDIARIFIFHAQVIV